MSVNGCAFDGCSGLSNIIVEEGNENYDSRNDCNAIIEKSSNKLIVGCKNTKIPDSITSVGNYAFSGCRDLTSIILPNSVTSIGDFAFNKCENLADIVIPDRVTYVGNSAFSECEKIEKLVIPDSVTYIGWTAFSGCKNLKSITIPEKVERIFDGTFEECDNLTSIKWEGDTYTSLAAFLAAFNAN